jgi:hypothetical protein
MEAMALSVSPTASPNESFDDWEGARFLEFERAHWGVTESKEDDVLKEFALSLPAYYQRLYRWCRSAEGLAYDAHLVRMILEAADAALLGRTGSAGGEQ